MWTSGHFAMHMMAAASPEEPAADQPLSPRQLSPDARRQAAALLATRVPRVRVTNACWRKPRRSAARRRADLDEQSGGYDAWEYPPDAQQDTHQERIEKADANWRRTLPQRQSQRLASAQRHDATRAAAKQAVLASVQADIDKVVHTDACCHIGQHFSQQQGHQGRLLQQGDHFSRRRSHGGPQEPSLRKHQWGPLMFVIQSTAIYNSLEVVVPPGVV